MPRTVLLSSYFQDVIVGNAENRGVSGGQLKRVNIGLELVPPSYNKVTLSYPKVTLSYLELL